MIRTDRGLSATRESLMSLEEALLDLTRHRAEYHPRTFELLAAPIREEILARRSEIDEYIGLTPQAAAVTAHGPAGSASTLWPPSIVRRGIGPVTVHPLKNVTAAAGSRSSQASTATVSFADIAS
jgi:hypothetical protein